MRKPNPKLKRSMGEAVKPSVVRSALDDWLERIERQRPDAIELGLERTAVVAERLEVLQPAPRVISVGGTNGKGSCVAFLEHMLHGVARTGSYTSPHLLRYNERIRINGQAVADQDIVAAFEVVERACGDTYLTYFEYGTLAALLLFVQNKVDIALLEVGMGGRLDAVNVVDADVAVITSIDIDHQEWLGPDREAIGREKAGIARRGRPFICADPKPPQSLVTAVKKTGAQGIYIGSPGFRCTIGENTIDIESRLDGGQLKHYTAVPKPELPLPSGLCALQALNCLDLSPQVATLRRTFAETRLPGRQQRYQLGQGQVLLDVAHNPAATQRLAQKVASLSAEGQVRRVIALFSALADKDVGGMIAPMLPLVDVWRVAQLSGVSRAMPVDELARHVRIGGASAQTYRDVESACTGILQQFLSGDLLVVFGSFHTVGEVMGMLDNCAEDIREI